MSCELDPKTWEIIQTDLTYPIFIFLFYFIFFFIFLFFIFFFFLDIHKNIEINHLFQNVRHKCMLNT